MAREISGRPRRRDFESDDLRYGGTPDRRPRGMRDEVDYDRDYSREDRARNRAVDAEDEEYGSYGGYGRGEGAFAQYRGGAYGGKGRGEGDFASYAGSSGQYDERHRQREDAPDAYPRPRHDERSRVNYARDVGYFDRGAGSTEYPGRHQAERDYRRRTASPGSDERGFWDRAGDEISSWFGDEEAARRREQDHRGRGPRDYQRSDARILEDVNDRLTDDGAVDASDVSVAVSQREVTLSGEVKTRAEKRRAEDVAEMVSGVLHVQNNLRVARRDNPVSGSPVESRQKS